jgi:hypothetical protein
MKIRNVNFDEWLRSHRTKATKERWLRELYPWPVLANVDCDKKNLGEIQKIQYDGADYDVTLIKVDWQPQQGQQGTFRYRIRVESDGLGWHARSFADVYDLCASRDGHFVTLFHRKKEEPLEKIAKAFFSRQWGNLPPRRYSRASQYRVS